MPRDDRWQFAEDAGCLFGCDGPETASAEWDRKALKSDGPIEAIRLFGWFELRTDDAIDLCDEDVRVTLGVTASDLVGDDPTWCRAILRAARHLGVEVVIGPSAARPDGRTVIVLPHALERAILLRADRQTPPFRP